LSASAALPESATGREIAQQARLWSEVAATAADRRTETEAFLAPLLARADLRIVLTGAGSSAFAGQLVAPGLARSLGRRVDAVPTTDVVADPRAVFAQDVPTLLVSFARSGDSPESVAATVLAEQCLTSVSHLVVTCNSDGTLAREHAERERSLVLLMPAAAHDSGFAMTSSFTCMVLASWLTLRRLESDAEPVRSAAAAADQVLGERVGELTELVQRGYRRVVFLGSGGLGGLARESALKLVELTAGRIVTSFDTALGFRHGPKAFLDGQTLAVVYLSNDPYTRRYDEDIAVELRAALGPRHVLVLAGRPSERLGADGAWVLDGLDRVDDIALGVVFAVVAQVFALCYSAELGLTPDNPFPSGEVNRVVQGVTVHALDG
jgi:tagatose-6-phosphate ketose/aldose isomerase